MLDVVVIGAGPYGLSIAAHLKKSNLDYRIVGNPMYTWREQMPKGMRLKSEGFASSLYDPDGRFKLADYCKQRNLPYADSGLPVPIETFVSYGMEFQKTFAPELENKLAVSVERSSEGFVVRLEDGQTMTARKVITAAGISHFKHVPEVLANLPEEFVTHSSRHNTLDKFRNREVAVVGAGASAVDLAALLREAGADVQLIARKPAIHFHSPPGKIPAPILDRLRYPPTTIGPGWKLLLCSRAPHVFHHMPERFRLRAVRRILGPAPGWFVRDQVVGKMPFHLGMSLDRATVEKGRVNLQLTDSSGKRRTLSTEHVIAATGYKVDLRRLTFLSPEILAKIRNVDQTPVLSSNFESSVPGLYFVGVAAANAFGPLLRFACGAKFAAQRVSHHLATSSQN